MRTKILIVDDDPDILEFLKFNLEKENYKVYTATNGEQGIKKAQEKIPDLIILDVMMPKIGGIEVCKAIRKLPDVKDTLIVFLTARGEDYSQIAGFEAGADDYIAKPLRPKVFLTRIKALMKRRINYDNANSPKQIVAGKLTIDTGHHRVFFDGKEIMLPQKEFKLISILASQPGKVFTREEIYAGIWGNDIVVGDRTIDVYIRKLRKKIQGKHIETIKCVGYRYVVDS